MHILGGFLVYGFFDAVLRVRKQKVDFLLIVALFLLCATVWEINEFFVRQVVERSWYGVFDTVKDYFDGLLGLSVGYYFIHKRKKS